MSPRRARRTTDPPAPDPGRGTTGRFEGERPIFHDEDDRPTREDRAPPPGSQFFSAPVPVPRFLRGRKARRKGS